MVATSTTKTKYVAAASCCGQVLWIQNQLLDYSQAWMEGYVISNVCSKNQKHLGMSKEVGTPRYPSIVVPLKKVGNEAVHKELGDRIERAATTASSLEAEQDSGHYWVIEVNAAKHTVSTAGILSAAMLMLGSVNAVRHILMLPVQVPAAEGVSINTSIKESDGFAEIIDFLKASSVHYALTVNPIIYTSCIEQFWTTAKVQTVNGVRQLQALVDKKRVIVTESSIRRDLHLDDAEGTDCLPTATIFEELARMGYEKPSQKLTFYKAFFSPQWKYFIHTITQCLSAKSTAWNEFSCSMASLIICLATNQKFNLSKYIFDAMVKHLDGGRQEAEVSQDETEHEECVPTPSNDPQPSGEDSMQLTDLMVLCTKLQTRVLDLEKAKDAQAKEIAALKKRIHRLERKKMSRPTGLKRLKKVGMSRRVESSEDQESLVAPEDASKQGRSIADIDTDVEVTLVDETQERQDDELMFDTGVLDTDEMPVESKVDEKDEQSTKLDDSTAGEAVTTASVEDSAAPTTIEEITLAQTLIQIKAATPKVFTTAATTTTTTRPKAKGSKKLAMGNKKEERHLAMIESWDSTQMRKKAKLFMELMEKRRKHFAALRAQEKRNKPPTKAQKRTQMLLS
ncbi:hypothetical protein Tco_0553618 [Tanacetum coccineum]